MDWAMRSLEDELGEALRAELLGWPGVTVRPMMGCVAFCHGRQMLGCYVSRQVSKKKPPWMNRPGEPPLAWVRLRAADAELAQKRPGVTHCRTGAKNWIDVPLESRQRLAEAVRWFGIAYENPPRVPGKRRRR